MMKACVVIVLLAACGGSKGDELGKDWSGVALDTTMS